MLRGQSLRPFIVSPSSLLITSSFITSSALRYPGKAQRMAFGTLNQKSPPPQDPQDLPPELLTTSGDPVNEQVLKCIRST